VQRILALVAAASLSACTTSAAPSHLDAGVDAPSSCQDVDGAIVGTPVATFDQDVGGFILDQAPGGAVANLGAPDAGTPPGLGWNGTEGNPAPGSLQIAAPFSGANQYLGAYDFFGCSAPHDWTDRVLRARIKIAGGDFSPIALVYVATSTTCATYDFAYGAFARLNHSSCWQELTLDLVSPASRTAGFDPTSVVDFGVQLYSGAGSDSQSANAAPTTVLVDSFSVQ
jgi:hypothetical protein